MHCFLYVVFSATPTGMGRFIRLATGHPWNHVSLSLDPNLETLWSFARHRRCAPLWGGLVRESSLRYQGARWKVCRLPLSEEAARNLEETLNRYWAEREDWLYHTPAALVSLAGYRPHMPRAHTCVSFALKILVELALPVISLPRHPTVSALEQTLNPFFLQEGPACPRGDWGEDPYPLPLTRRQCVWRTARHFMRLARRAVLGTR